MIEDGILCINDVNRTNFVEITGMQAELTERRISEISEVVYCVADSIEQLITNGIDISGALSVIANCISFDFLDGEKLDLLPENANRVISAFRSVGVHDSATFCELLLEELKKRTLNINESSFLPYKIHSDTVVFVKNPYSDEAYDVFSQELKDPHMRYVGALKDVIRCLSDDKTLCGLFPLEEHGGVRLPSVTEMIYRNNLKINSVTPVFGFDGCADMRFALVSHSFVVPELNGVDDRYLEIRIEKENSLALSELLVAAEQYGIGIYRLNTLSFDTEDGPKTYYSIVFRDNGRDFTSLLIYLTLFSGDFVPIGMYKNLE